MRHLIIDGMNFAHRARAGFQMGPHPLMFNFFRNLRALVEMHKPERIYYVLEGRPKANLELLPEYKANRKIDETLPGAEKKIEEMDRFFEGNDDVMELMMKAFPVIVIKHPDYECDDVAHNIALKALSASTPGVRVKMSEHLKDVMIANGSGDHIKEFGENEGIVQGYAEQDSEGNHWPEVDVRWQPDNLRYAYDPALLEVVDNAVIVSSDTDFIQSLQSVPGVKLYNAMKKTFVEAPTYDYVMWKSLRGDGSDNIPGIPGCGDKTATKLVMSPLHKELTEFLSKDPERGRVYDRNTTLIRFQTFTPEDWEGVVRHTGVADWDRVKTVFDSYGFASITNDKSWKKFTSTFDAAGK